MPRANVLSGPISNIICCRLLKEIREIWKGEKRIFVRCGEMGYVSCAVLVCVAIK